MKDTYARDSLNSPRRMSRFRLLVLDAPCTERYARCGERTGVNHPLLLDYEILLRLILTACKAYPLEVPLEMIFDGAK